MYKLKFLAKIQTSILANFENCESGSSFEDVQFTPEKTAPTQGEINRSSGPDGRGVKIFRLPNSDLAFYTKADLL